MSCAAVRIRRACANRRRRPRARTRPNPLIRARPNPPLYAGPSPTHSQNPQTYNAKRWRMLTIRGSRRWKFLATLANRWGQSRVACATQWSAFVACSGQSSSRAETRNVAVTDEHPTEVLAAYALGSVEAAERASVEAHLAVCAACASRLRAYQGVAAALPMSLAPVPPPPEAWETISATVREQRSHSRVRTKPTSITAWLRFARWPTVAAALAALLIWNVSLERELARRAPGPAPGPEVEALSRRPGRIVILAGTGKPEASARLFVAVDGGGHLAVSGLAPLPRERTYQLWFVQTGLPAVTGATFAVDSSGRAWVKVAVPSSLDNVQAIVVTEEPAPNASAPTGKHLLDALPWR